MNDSLVLKFWGVRGSYPTAQREMLGFGGNTSTVEIVTPHARLILDAGTGIIGLGQDMVRTPQPPLVLLLTHWHHDHLQGLPFFGPLFRPDTRLAIGAPARNETDMVNRLRQVMSPPQFPVEWNATRASKKLFALPDNRTLYIQPDGSLSYIPQHGAITVRTLQSSAHPSGVVLYRVEYRGLAIVYATDVESDANHASEIVEFARDADILIHDAQYLRAHYLGQPPFGISTHGYGHSTHEMASAVARAANVKQLVLFHHDPTYDDDTIARIQAQTRLDFAETIAAQEGMWFALNTSRFEPFFVLPTRLDATAAQKL